MESNWEWKKEDSARKWGDISIKIKKGSNCVGVGIVVGVIAVFPLLLFFALYRLYLCVCFFCFYFVSVFGAEKH